MGRRLRGQTEQLKGDIVVATPGRLVDHYYRATMRFKDIKILILDEVDRMLDMGFLPIVKKIVKISPWEGRQTLFFSATMPPAIASFAEWCLTDPETVEIARREAAKTVNHAFYPVSIDQRDEMLLELLKRNDFHSEMVFTRTRKEADAVSASLNAVQDLKVAVMHSDIKQRDRMAALKGFKEGEFNILVATDVAARGIDVSGFPASLTIEFQKMPKTTCIASEELKGRVRRRRFTILTATKSSLLSLSKGS